MSLKRMIKQWLPGLVSGVRRNPMFCALRAGRLARTGKRLDLCCAQLAQVFHLAGPPYPEGKVCLEIGSGWVLSHSLALHLMGASRVIATDLDAIAYPRSLAAAARSSVPSIIRDTLAPFSTHHAVRARLDRFLALPKVDEAALQQLGITYRAPLDLSREGVGESVDFVMSISVLEHVLTAEVPLLLKNLWADLSPGGRMIHCIHLEDHLDLQNDPLAFLGSGDEALTPEFQASRGNRIRAGQWLALFGALPGAEVRALYQYQRQDRPLPSRIAPQVVHDGENDLRTSHIGVLVTKRA